MKTRSDRVPTGRSPSRAHVEEQARHAARPRAASKRAIHSRDLGIHLESGKEAELFKWFLACLLFGKPIQQQVAKRTYLEFVREGLVTAEALLKAGWDRLVEILDRGHYVRFDFSTATKLLKISRALQERYGSLTNLLKQSSNRGDLVRRLQEFKGVGPTTMRIFLHDIKPLCRPGSGTPSR